MKHSNRSRRRTASLFATALFAVSGASFAGCPATNPPHVIPQDCELSVRNGNFEESLPGWAYEDREWTRETDDIPGWKLSSNQVRRVVRWSEFLAPRKPLPGASERVLVQLKPGQHMSQEVAVSRGGTLIPTYTVKIHASQVNPESAYKLRVLGRDESGATAVLADETVPVRERNSISTVKAALRGNLPESIRLEISAPKGEVLIEDVSVTQSYRTGG